MKKFMMLFFMLLLTINICYGAGDDTKMNPFTGKFDFYTAELNGLDDVNAGSPSDNDSLTWDDASSEWIPEAVAGGGGDDVYVDSADVTDPDFLSTGDIDFIDDGVNNITADINAGTVDPIHLSNSDFGGFTCNAGSCSIGANAVGDSQIDETTYGATVNWLDDASDASSVWTWKLSGATDPAITFGNNSVDVTSGVLKEGGSPVFTEGDGALNDDDLSDNTTDDLSEGSTNKYDDDLGVNEVYGSGWNADPNAPEKDDVYDYLHQIDTDDDGDVDNFDATNLAAAETDPNVDTATEILAIIDNTALDFGTGVLTATGFTIGSAAILEAELEILDGATLGTGDINIIDGISDSGSLTATELLYVDGVSSGIQTQLDGKMASTLLKDVVATAPLTVNAGTNVDDILPGSDADITLAVSAASTTATGVSELATAAETTTGTDATRAVTPDALAGSIFGTKTVILKTQEEGDSLTTGNGKIKFAIPVELNGMDLVSVGAHVYTASTSGDLDIDIYNYTDSADMLSTNIDIDATEKDSATAGTAAVIDGTNDDVVTGDEIGVDVDGAGTGAKGLEVRLGFRLP